MGLTDRLKSPDLNFVLARENVIRRAEECLDLLCFLRSRLFPIFYDIQIANILIYFLTTAYF